MEQIRDFFYRTSMLWKTAIATSMSWQVCIWLGITRPILSPVAATLCLQITIDDSVKRAYQRIAGTIMGVIFTWFIAQKWGIHTWSIGLVALLSMAVGRVIQLNEQIISQTGTTALLVFVMQSQNHRYPLDRILETIVGGILAVLVNIFIFPPDFTKEAIQSVERFSKDLAGSFEQTGIWLEKGCPSAEGMELHQKTHGLLEELHKAITHFEKAQASLKYNPLAQRNRSRLEILSGHMFHLRQGYAHINGMLRTLREWADTNTMKPEDRENWMHHMFLIAVYITDWQKSIKPDQEATPLSLPNFEQFQHVKKHDRFKYALYNDAIQTVEDFGSIVH